MFFLPHVHASPQQGKVQLVSNVLARGKVVPAPLASLHHPEAQTRLLGA